MENQAFITVLVAIGFMTVAAFASQGLKRLNFPYTIGLVVIGLVTGSIAWQFNGTELLRGLELSPEIIMYLILPCLIFEAAINIDVRLLVRNLVPILLLAAPGLVISTFAVGGLLSWTTFLPLAGALVFGALISATDPVAVIALFKDIGAPRRLVTMIDGESVFNDATAIVMFTIVMGAVGTATGQPGNVNVAGGIFEFVLVLVGGLLVGGILGFLGSLVFQMDRSGLEFQKIISLIVAYGSFLVSDHVFHFSGVMASLAAGLIIRYRAEVSVKLSNIENIEHAWGFFSFVANSFVFILLGLTEVHTILYKGNVFDNIVVILVSIPVVLVARALCIWLILPFYNMVRRKTGKEPVPFTYQLILFWGGLRGAVPVALVLAIPLDFPNRDIILHITMANILFTLLFQGTTIKWLMDKLGVKPDDSEFDDRVVMDTRFDFPTQDLAKLMLMHSVDAFAAEGFLVRVKKANNQVTYMMRKGRQILALRQDDRNLVCTSEEREIDYVNTVINETLLELKVTVASMKEVSQEGDAQQKARPRNPSKNAAVSVTLDVMKMIRLDQIKVPMASRTKAEAIRELLLLCEGVLDPEAALSDVLEREQKVNSGMGGGLAMPHAKTNAVDHPIVAIGLQPDGIEYQAPDGKPVRFLVMILSPADDANPHLEILSAIGKIMNSEGIQQALFAAKKPEEIDRIIRLAAGPRQRELI